MKKIFSLFILSFTVLQSLFAQCNSGSITIAGNSVINGSCVITGDLTILNGATLDVDLTSATVDTFVVQGNILLQGNAILWVHAAPGSTGEQFILSNTFNGQRTISTLDSSKIQLENIEFRTQEGDLASASSIYINYYAADKSILYVDKSWLDPEKAWVLFNMSNESTLIGYEPQKLPTEIYLQDSVQVELHGPGTDVGLWLNFQSITDTLNLPPYPTLPYNYIIGRGFGGVNTAWYLEMDTVISGLGVQIFPTTTLTINGAGFPATGELKVAMMLADGTDTLRDLNVGLQNLTVPNGINGSVTLNNVNLGPIAWQVYALMNENLYIKNSIINEIGIGGPSNVVVDSCLLQLAVLAAVGIGGSAMTINDSEIWNQEITATNNSIVTLNNCNIYGSTFRTMDTLSEITVNGGCFFANPTGCTQETMVNISTGQPFCNPFIPPGLPQILTPETIILNDVNSNCSTFVEFLNDISGQITIYPNPASYKIEIKTNNANIKSIKIYSITGNLMFAGNTTEISIKDLPPAAYFIIIQTENSTTTHKIIKAQ